MSKSLANKKRVSAFCAVPLVAAVAIASFALFSGPRHGSAKSTAPQAARARVQANYAALPLAFEQNQGQTDSQVKYMARGDGYTLFLTPKEAVFSLRSQSNAGKSSTEHTSPGAKNCATMQEATAVVRMKLAGANLPASVSASDPLPGKSNYFIGNDPAKWRTDVPHYARVSYRDVYPGVDLAFHGAQRQTEFDFLVAPGADPTPIAFNFTGARGIKTNGSGDLVIASAAGNILLHKPVAYQEANGTRQPVDAQFIPGADNQVRIALGNYDLTRELVIDPAVNVAYSTYLGGSNNDSGYGITFDSSGDAYVTGETSSTNFPTTSGVFQGSLPNGSTGNAFVTKISADGSTLVYSTYVGGKGEDAGNSIALDASGDAFVTGGTSSTDFPVTSGVFQSTCKSCTGTLVDNAFVFELNPTGSALTYSTYIGGTGSDEGLGIALAKDSSGDVVIAGKTSSQDFPTMNPLQGYLSGSTTSGFVTKLNSSGAALVYSTYLGGGDGDSAQGIALDSLDNAYVTGQTFNSSFTTTAGAFQTKCGSCSNGNSNAYVAVINPAGSAFVYSSFLGGSGVDAGSSIAVDSSGNAYVTGSTTSSNFPTTPGAFQTTLGGTFNAFITKVNPSGSALVYSTYVGGSGRDSAAGIAIDGGNDAYITGQTTSSNFPVVGATQSTLGAGAVSNAFVTEINVSGSQLLFSTYLGGSGEDDAGALGAIAVDGPGATIYVTGNTTPTPPATNNFPVTPGAFQTTPGGLTDAFVTTYAQPAFSLSATTPSPVSPGSQTTSSVTLTSLNGYSSAVTLSCSVASVTGGSPMPTCSVTGTPVTPVPSPGATSTVTISTTAPGNAQPNHRTRLHAMWLPVAGLSLLGMCFATPRSQRRKMLGIVMVGVLTASFVLMPACGSSSSTTSASCMAVPAAPTGLAASNTTSTGTSLTWTAPSVSGSCAISGYTIYNGTTTYTSSTTSYNVAGLSPSTTYNFTVAASDQAGLGPQSAALPVTTGAAGTPSGNYTLTITGTDASGRSQTTQVPFAVN